VIGPNVTIRNSSFHDPIHSDSDPNQPDGKTHDDGIQVEGGTNILIENNKIIGFHNAQIQVTQNYSATKGVTIRNNQFTGGGCQVNVTDKGAGGAGAPISSFSLTGNGFGGGVYGLTCPMRLPKTSSFTYSGNYWLLSGLVAVPNLF
jgi:parallel beta helix pectate lyase-like protein